MNKTKRKLIKKNLFQTKIEKNIKMMKNLTIHSTFE